MIKHCLLALMLAALVSAVTPSAFAQDSGTNEQQSGPAMQAQHGYGHNHLDPEKRTAMLTKQLNLSSDQQTKVEDILKSEKSQMDSLRSDSSASQEDRHSKMMEIHKSSNEQIRALLDPDQQKKFDEMQSKQMERYHHGGPAPSGTTPNSTPPQQ
jgi:periplasmic protein CpxP/Spy